MVIILNSLNSGKIAILKERKRSKTLAKKFAMKDS